MPDDSVFYHSAVRKKTVQIHASCLLDYTSFFSYEINLVLPYSTQIYAEFNLSTVLRMPKIADLNISK